MKPIEELSNDLLILNYFYIYTFYHHSQETWVLESVVLIFDLSLREGEQASIMIDPFSYELAIPLLYNCILIDQGGIAICKIDCSMYHSMLIG